MGCGALDCGARRSFVQAAAKLPEPFKAIASRLDMFILHSELKLDVAAAGAFGREVHIAAQADAGTLQKGHSSAVPEFLQLLWKMSSSNAAEIRWLEALDACIWMVARPSSGCTDFLLKTWLCHRQSVVAAVLQAAKKDKPRGQMLRDLVTGWAVESSVLAEDAELQKLGLQIEVAKEGAAGVKDQKPIQFSDTETWWDNGEEARDILGALARMSAVQDCLKNTMIGIASKLKSGDRRTSFVKSMIVSTLWSFGSDLVDKIGSQAVSTLRKAKKAGFPSEVLLEQAVNMMTVIIGILQDWRKTAAPAAARAVFEAAKVVIGFDLAVSSPRADSATGPEAKAKKPADDESDSGDSEEERAFARMSRTASAQSAEHDPLADLNEESPQPPPPRGFLFIEEVLVQGLRCNALQKAESAWVDSNSAERQAFRQAAADGGKANEPVVSFLRTLEVPQTDDEEETETPPKTDATGESVLLLPPRRQHADLELLISKGLVIRDPESSPEKKKATLDPSIAKAVDFGEASSDEGEEEVPMKGARKPAGSELRFQGVDHDDDEACLGGPPIVRGSFAPEDEDDDFEEEAEDEPMGYREKMEKMIQAQAGGNVPNVGGQDTRRRSLLDESSEFEDGDDASDHEEHPAVAHVDPHMQDARRRARLDESPDFEDEDDVNGHADDPAFAPADPHIQEPQVTALRSLMQRQGMEQQGDAEAGGYSHGTAPSSASRASSKGRSEHNPEMNTLRQTAMQAETVAPLGGMGSHADNGSLTISAVEQRTMEESPTFYVDPFPELPEQSKSKSDDQSSEFLQPLDDHGSKHRFLSANEVFSEVLGVREPVAVESKESALESKQNGRSLGEVTMMDSNSHHALSLGEVRSVLECKQSGRFAGEVIVPDTSQYALSFGEVPPSETNRYSFGEAFDSDSSTSRNMTFSVGDTIYEGMPDAMNKLIGTQHSQLQTVFEADTSADQTLLGDRTISEPKSGSEPLPYVTRGTPEPKCGSGPLPHLTHREDASGKRGAGKLPPRSPRPAVTTHDTIKGKADNSQAFDAHVRMNALSAPPPAMQVPPEVLASGGAFVGSRGRAGSMSLHPAASALPEFPVLERPPLQQAAHHVPSPHPGTHNAVQTDDVGSLGPRIDNNLRAALDNRSAALHTPPTQYDFQPWGRLGGPANAANGATPPPTYFTGNHPLGAGLMSLHPSASALPELPFLERPPLPQAAHHIPSPHPGAHNATHLIDDVVHQINQIDRLRAALDSRSSPLHTTPAQYDFQPWGRPGGPSNVASGATPPPTFFTGNLPPGAVVLAPAQHGVVLAPGAPDMARIQMPNVVSTAIPGMATLGSTTSHGSHASSAVVNATVPKDNVTFGDPPHVDTTILPAEPPQSESKPAPPAQVTINMPPQPKHEDHDAELKAQLKDLTGELVNCRQQIQEQRMQTAILTTQLNSIGLQRTPNIAQDMPRVTKSLQNMPRLDLDAMPNPMLAIGMQQPPLPAAPPALVPPTLFSVPPTVGGEYDVGNFNAGAQQGWQLPHREEQPFITWQAQGFEDEQWRQDCQDIQWAQEMDRMVPPLPPQALEPVPSIKSRISDRQNSHPLLLPAVPFLPRRTDGLGMGFSYSSNGPQPNRAHERQRVGSGNKYHTLDRAETSPTEPSVPPFRVAPRPSTSNQRLRSEALNKSLNDMDSRIQGLDSKFKSLLG